MASVVINPMPDYVRARPARLRPHCPPIFTDGTPTPADIALARDLFLALDSDSQAWYGGNTFLEWIEQRLST